MIKIACEKIDCRSQATEKNSRNNILNVIKTDYAIRIMALSETWRLRREQRALSDRTLKDAAEIILLSNQHAYRDSLNERSEIFSDHE